MLEKHILFGVAALVSVLLAQPVLAAEVYYLGGAGEGQRGR